MTAVDEATVWQEGIAEYAVNRSRWFIGTTLLTDLARNRASAEVREKIGDFTYWITFTAQHPELVEPGLLSDFVGQFGRLASNLGRGEQTADTMLIALDEAIALQRQAGGPATDLYLAKASYLSGEFTESELRLAALHAAVNTAEPGTEAWASAMIAMSNYEVDISRYAKAIRTARKVRDGMPAGLLDGKYDCAAMVLEGVALFTSFQDLHLAEKRLLDACNFEDRAAEDQDIGKWVAMAFHYRARVAEVDRRYRRSLSLYLKAKELAERSREDLVSDSFTHLRISEPLVASGRFSEARDHLDQAYALVRLSSNRGSLRLQVDLGYATLEAADGDPVTAVRTVERASRRARSVGFWRGELLCQGYLLALAIRQRAILRIPRLALRIVSGVIYGELRRNNLLRLLIRVPVVLRVALRRMSRRRRTRHGANSNEMITECPCGLHDGPQAVISRDENGQGATKLP